MYHLNYTKEAVKNLKDLKTQGNLNKLKKIRTTLELLQDNPRHPGLHTHKNQSFKTYNKCAVFQSYIENKTPGAFRVFWHYGLNAEEITILAIIPHP